MFSKNHFKNTFAAILLAAFLFFGTPDAHAGFLYVLNDDSNGSQIYGFQVNEQTGALTLLSGFPVSPGNGGINSVVSERMIADTANRRLYVINDTSDTITAYSIDGSTGALTAMPFSPIALGAGTWNTIAVHPSGSPLIAGNGSSTIGGGGVRSFVITPTTATAVTGNPFPITGTTAFSSEFSQDGNYYYVGGNTGNGIFGFEVNAATGVLTALAGSPFDTGAANPIAYALDSSGRMFTMNSNDDIRAFTSMSGILSPVTGNPFPPSGMTQRRFGIVHPNQNFYMIAGNSGNNVGVFQISGSGAGTTLTAVTGSPFATGGTTANNLAINADGTFLYVGNRISRNITTFSVNTSTGELSNRVVQPSNTLGTVGAINGIAYVPDIPILVPFEARADFDGDGRTDFSVFRPSEGNWYLERSTNGFEIINWGQPGDTIIPGDYDGDGRADPAVFRPNDDKTTTDFYILNTKGFIIKGYSWGLVGDIPLAGDYDGDGKTDIAVWRPSTGVWYIHRSSDASVTVEPFGQTGDIPLVMDFNGDGTDQLAVFRPNESRWYIARPTGVPAQNFDAVPFGQTGDLLVPADYDGDAKDDIAVFRPSNGTWYIRQTANGSVNYIPFGTAGDIPVPGDYDGDGRDDQAVYRNGTWYLRQSTNGFAAFQFGLATDEPVPAAYTP